MKIFTHNKKTLMISAAIAVFLSFALMHGCGSESYDNDYVQIDNGATTTSDVNVTLTLHVKNDNYTDAYYISDSPATESPAAPAANDGNWQPIPNSRSSTVYHEDIQSALTDTSPGMKTVYVWFKDGYQNVFGPVSDTITYESAGAAGPVAPGY